MFCPAIQCPAIVLGEGVSRRTGSSTRPQRAFSWRVETRTRSRRGLSNFAQTRACTRRVVLCPRPTALLRRYVSQTLHEGITSFESELTRRKEQEKCLTGDLGVFRQVIKKLYAGPVVFDRRSENLGVCQR